MLMVTDPANFELTGKIGSTKWETAINKWSKTPIISQGYGTSFYVGVVGLGISSFVGLAAIVPLCALWYSYLAKPRTSNAPSYQPLESV